MSFKANIKKLLLIFSIIYITNFSFSCETAYANNIETQQQFFSRYDNTNYYLKESEKKFGIYDENNNEILPCIFDKITKDYNDFIWVIKDNKQGLYYKTQEVISPVYKKIIKKGRYSNSTLYSCLKQNEKIDIKYFNYKNEQMYDLMKDCDEFGFKQQHWVYKNNIFYIPVKKNNCFGLISFDTKTFETNEILPFEYENMRYFFYSQKNKKIAYEYLCVKKNGKYCLLNFKDFKPACDGLYDDVETLVGTKFIKVKNNNKYALYDTSKNISGEFLYDNIIYQIKQETPVVYVIKNEKWKSINKGQLVLKSVKDVGKTVLLSPFIIACIACPPLGFAVFMGMEDGMFNKYKYSYVEY